MSSYHGDGATVLKLVLLPTGSVITAFMEGWYLVFSVCISEMHRQYNVLEGTIICLSLHFEIFCYAMILYALYFIVEKRLYF